LDRDEARGTQGGRESTCPTKRRLRRVRAAQRDLAEPEIEARGRGLSVEPKRRAEEGSRLRRGANRVEQHGQIEGKVVRVVEMIVVWPRRPDQLADVAPQHRARRGEKRPQRTNALRDDAWIGTTATHQPHEVWACMCRL